MMFLKILFYLFWASYLIYQVFFLINFKKSLHDRLNLFVALDKLRNKEKLREVISEEMFPSFIFSTVFGYCGLFFRFVGLFTANWLIFLIWIIWDISLSSLMMYLRKKDSMTSYAVATFFFEFVDALLTLFVILNAFHFHLTYKQLISFIW